MKQEFLISLRNFERRYQKREKGGEKNQSIRLREGLYNSNN